MTSAIAHEDGPWQSLITPMLLVDMSSLVRNFSLYSYTQLARDAQRKECIWGMRRKSRPLRAPLWSGYRCLCMRLNVSLATLCPLTLVVNEQSEGDNVAEGQNNIFLPAICRTIDIIPSPKYNPHWWYTGIAIPRNSTRSHLVPRQICTRAFSSCFFIVVETHQNKAK